MEQGKIKEGYIIIGKLKNIQSQIKKLNNAFRYLHYGLGKTGLKLTREEIKQIKTNPPKGRFRKEIKNIKIGI